ncbi:MAG: peptidase M50 [Chloroflexota bacterium]|nr:site-2 protease family protein [Chloroflexota bacterium]NOG62527.1 site-2 protease family protein [Chloroflexota bacterium]GIK64220.1 MAG: peptidase M50 [Chloroflexota bacterium]
MLPEQSQNSDAIDIPQVTTLPPREVDDRLRLAVATVLDIEETTNPPAPNIEIQYVGQLRVPSEGVIDQLDPTLEQLGVHAYLSQDDETGKHLITVVRGRYTSRAWPWWPNLVLLMMTILSLLFVGAGTQAGVENRDVENFGDIRLLEGWPYALSLMLILGAHELGHYFMARRYRVNATLPYFIPMPFGLFGTLGAFIMLRGAIKNRKVLFDVGAAGPLAGLIFAIPILIIGLATSDIKEIPKNEDITREGNSLLYAAAKIAIFGRFVPDGDEDVYINQLAMAGWTGLFVTALNLVPLGQLDGGHVIYTLFGRRVRKLYVPVLAIFVTLTVLVSLSWALWTLLLLLFGWQHPAPLDDVTPLGRRRRLIGYIALIIFVLVFVPNPIQFIPAGSR